MSCRPEFVLCGDSSCVNRGIPIPPQYHFINRRKKPDKIAGLLILQAAGQAGNLIRLFFFNFHTIEHFMESFFVLVNCFLVAIKLDKVVSHSIGFDDSR